MGAAMALYSATSCALGRYGNGNPYPINLTVVVGLSGWLPGSRCGIIQNYFLSRFAPSLLCQDNISFARNHHDIINSSCLTICLKYQNNWIPYNLKFLQIIAVHAH